MDLETENHLAALLMEEAQRLRREADREGVHVYLHQHKARGRPNSRFLTATVLGVQQANRAVEINEMWRAREKEIELDNRLASKPKNNTRGGGEKHHVDSSDDEHTVSTEKKKGRRCTYLHSSSKYSCDASSSIEDDGLGDEEVDKFLHSRVKRGRGAVGSRMDEPGPYPKYLPNILEDNAPATSDSRVKEDWERRVLGPERPPSLNLHEREEENAHYQKKIKSGSSKKQHSNQKHQSSEVKHRTKRRKSKCSKHRHRSE